MSIRENLQAVREKIAAASDSVGRSPEEVTLIAVSKQQSLESILQAYECGQRHFGESRLQEAIPKIENAPKDIVWHFIGRLQSNKVARISELFPVIHGFDKTSQLQRVVNTAHNPVEGFIQVNLEQEEQKGGIFPGELDKFTKTVLQYESVRFRGLMMIGRFHENPEESRPAFRHLMELAKRYGYSEASFGMSGDYVQAIQEGSTHVRVGTAIFGSRVAPRMEN